MIIVLDDVLPNLSSELTTLIDKDLIALDWYDLKQDHIYKEFCLSILDIAGQYFDLSNTIGYEFWGHNGTKPDWHYDKDEALFEQKGELDFPLCSTAYYLEASNIIGGQLIVENDMITPKTNRLAIFSPGKYHTVQPYKGKRVSLLVNPWSHPLWQ